MYFSLKQNYEIWTTSGALQLDTPCPRPCIKSIKGFVAMVLELSIFYVVSYAPKTIDLPALKYFRMCHLTILLFSVPL